MDEEIQNLDSQEKKSLPAEASAKAGWWERKTGEKLKRSEKVAGIAFLVIFLLVFYVTLDANKYGAVVRAIEGEGKVGINPTTERLDFGDLSRGTSAVRTVTVKNESAIPFFVTVVRIGEIRGLTKMEKNNFVLRKGEEQQLNFTVYMPASAEIDHIYKGRVFVFKIPAPFF